MPSMRPLLRAIINKVAFQALMIALPETQGFDAAFLTDRAERERVAAMKVRLREVMLDAE